MDYSNYNYGVEEKREYAVKDYPFPYKLWIVTNSKTIHCVQWDLSGTKILINPFQLQTYLLEKDSIFHVKNLSDFIAKITEYGFTKCYAEEYLSENGIDTDNVEASLNLKTEESINNITAALEQYSLYEIYQNANFIKDKYELLENVRKENPFGKEFDDIFPLLEEIVLQNSVLQQQMEEADADLVDPCVKIFDDIPAMVGPRTLLRAAIEAQCPGDVYENALESVSGFPENSEYAGFYGRNLDPEMVKSFFSEYLPVYVHTNTTGELRGGMPMDEDIPRFDTPNYDLEQKYRDSLMGNFDAAAMNYPGGMLEAGKLPDTLNLSNDQTYTKVGQLEPIFADEEIPDGAMVQNCEDDISMDEYLKFNRPNSFDNQNASSANNLTLIDDNSACFINGYNNATASTSLQESYKSFFDQYRDSMNVLYEN